jgi:hypothetical protein
VKRKSERIWKEAVVPNLRYYCPGIKLEGLRKTTKNIKKYSRSSGDI